MVSMFFLFFRCYFHKIVFDLFYSRIMNVCLLLNAAMIIIVAGLEYQNETLCALSIIHGR